MKREKFIGLGGRNFAYPSVKGFRLPEFKNLQPRLTCQTRVKDPPK